MKKSPFLIIIYTALLLISCCSSKPSIRQMQDESKDFTLPITPEKNNSVVYVVRPWTYRGGLGRFHIFLDSRDDNSEIGYTKNGMYLYFSVTPGNHVIYSKADNWDSISFKAEAGENIFIKQNPVWGIVLGGNKLEIISEIEGKHLLMKSKKGDINNN